MRSARRRLVSRRVEVRVSAVLESRLREPAKEPCGRMGGLPEVHGEGQGVRRRLHGDAGQAVAGKADATISEMDGAKRGAFILASRLPARTTEDF